MKATKARSVALKILFPFCLLFTSLTFCENWRTAFMFRADTRLLKFILSIVLPFAAAALSITADKSLRFAGRLSAAAMVVFIVHFWIDTNTVHLIDCYGSFMIPYHLAYAMLSFFSVFAAAVLLSLSDKRLKDGFPRFYRVFFHGYTLIFIFLFLELFFILRENNPEHGINLIPFQGELGKLLAGGEGSVSALNLIRFAGNILFFATAPLLLVSYMKKPRAGVLIPVPAALSLCAEIFQAFSNTGDCDIDDFLLNTAGVLLGFAVYKFIEKKLLTEEKVCLES